jgi:hypothetical protein
MMPAARIQWLGSPSSQQLGQVEPQSTQTLAQQSPLPSWVLVLGAAAVLSGVFLAGFFTGLLVEDGR